MLEINLKQLEAFVATAEHSSFTRAAEDLYLTQSTVSAHISALERTLGSRLIQRGARKKVALTEVGKRIYEEAKDILAHCQALQSLSEVPSKSELSLGASTVPGQYLLPALLSGFLHRYPDSRYLLRRGDSVQIHRLLEQGEVRIGFVGAAIDRKNFTYYSLLEDRLVLITANTERFRSMRAREVTGQELLSQPIILREDTSGTKQALDAYLRRNHIAKETLHPVAQMDNPEAIKSSVARGMGVSVISQLSVQEEVEAGKLLCFDLDPGGAFRKIYLAWRKDLILSGPEQKFVGFVRAALRRQDHRSEP